MEFSEDLINAYDCNAQIINENWEVYKKTAEINKYAAIKTKKKYISYFKKGKAKIKAGKRLLNIYIKIYGLNNIKTVRASQRLDKILNKYNFGRNQK